MPKTEQAQEAASKVAAENIAAAAQTEASTSATTYTTASPTTSAIVGPEDPAHMISPAAAAAAPSASSPPGKASSSHHAAHPAASSAGHHFTISPQSAAASAGLRGKPVPASDANLGTFLASRLLEVGASDVFAVPGDFNLLLLDQLIKAEPQGLNMVYCCNELNAGYAADGYARKKGVGCMVVTFCVGGLSAINAVAGAYSEDLPVIVVSGCPNSNDYASNRVLHHTTGVPEYGQQLRAFREVTCAQVTVRHIETATSLIDHAISEAILHRKPAYIEIACNLADLHHSSFERLPIPYSLSYKQTNQRSLAAAVDTAAAALSKAAKPLLLTGPCLRPAACRSALLRLADASGYAIAVLPDGKGMVPEDHPHYMGMYWGAASSPMVCEAVEASDLVVCVGAVWTDYSTVGYSTLLAPHKMIIVDKTRVTVCGGPSFGCINMKDFLEALAAKAPHNDTAWVNFERMYLPPSVPDKQPEGQLLRTNVLFKHLQGLINKGSVSAVLSEVGDSWFNTLKLKLPRGVGFELQLRYGSIGWSVGATLGYATAERAMREKRALKSVGMSGIVAEDTAASAGTAGFGHISPRGSPGAGASKGPPSSAAPSSSSATVSEHDKGSGAEGNGGEGMAVADARRGGGAKVPRLLAVIGDGSFQMTAQDVSTMMRYGLNPIIVLVNNGAYTIEVEIHDGPYNVIQNWDYIGMVSAVRNHKDGQPEGELFTARVTTESELEAVLKELDGPDSPHANKLVFIEAVVHRDDCSKELLEWGSRVAAANSRKPIPV